MMDKCILFGAGVMGNKAYHKLKDRWDIVAYSDNNSARWGSSINGLPIIPPSELKDRDEQIIVCAAKYPEIMDQLKALGISDAMFMDTSGLLYRYQEQCRYVPVPSQKRKGIQPYKKPAGVHRGILFFQDAPCIRTNRIACVLKKKGWDINLACTHKPIGFLAEYSNIYVINTFDELISLVNGSEFDIVHSSNEPDAFTNILFTTNKRIVHDTHDVMSFRDNMDLNGLALEYLANTQADGNIYVSEAILNRVQESLGYSVKDPFVLPNLPLERSLQLKARLPKLSASDGEIHCVYEGGMHKDRNYHRYFEDIWGAITKEHIHIHFYSNQEVEYCRALANSNEYLHYEGFLDLDKLLVEMTRYDCGLLLFNLTPQVKGQLEDSSPNKMFEYAIAGLPQLVGDIKAHRDFVEKYHLGRRLDFSDDIRKQIEDVCKLRIDKDVLTKNDLTLDSYADALIAFYEKIIADDPVRQSAFC